MRRTEKFADVAEGFDGFKKLDRILDRLNELSAEIRTISEYLYHIARYDDAMYDRKVHEKIEEIFDSREE